MVVAGRSSATTRYLLLESLRQFGEARLVLSGDARARRARHLGYFVDVAERTRQQLASVDAPDGMRLFDREWDNLRAAFEWAATTAELDAAVRMVTACCWFACLSHRYELLAWAERAMAMDGAANHELAPVLVGVVGAAALGHG